MNRSEKLIKNIVETRFRQFPETNKKEQTVLKVINKDKSLQVIVSKDSKGLTLEVLEEEKLNVVNSRGDLTNKSYTLMAYHTKLQMDKLDKKWGKQNWKKVIDKDMGFDINISVKELKDLYNANK